MANPDRPQCVIEVGHQTLSADASWLMDGDPERPIHDVSRERGAVASRLSQLEHDGMVRKVGVCQIPTGEGGTGRAEFTWAVTDAGRAAL